MAPRNDAWATPVVTERLETLAVRSNVLARTDPVKIVECTSLMIERANEWANPFGLVMGLRENGSSRY
jgi:hypothetical protein